MEAVGGGEVGGLRQQFQDAPSRCRVQTCLHLPHEDLSALYVRTQSDVRISWKEGTAKEGKARAAPGCGGHGKTCTVGRYLSSPNDLGRTHKDE